MRIYRGLIRYDLIGDIKPMRSGIMFLLMENQIRQHTLSLSTFYLYKLCFIPKETPLYLGFHFKRRLSFAGHLTLGVI